MLQCVCPLVALRRHQAMSALWSLSGEERTSGMQAKIDAIDPKRTFSTATDLTTLPSQSWAGDCQLRADEVIEYT
jgi:hypothetical protein